MVLIRKRKWGPMAYGAASRNIKNMIFGMNKYGRTMHPSKRFRGAKKKYTSGRGITKEDDRSAIYRKRRAPRRFRSRWKKQVRKFAYMDQYKLGTRTVVFNKQLEFQEGGAGLQLLAHFTLYGGESVDSHIDDVQYISDQLEPIINPAGGSTSAPYLAGSGKLFFRSGVLDLTVRNTSYDGGSATVIGDTILEIDVYEIISSKKWVENDNATGLKQFSSIIGTGQLYASTLSEMDVLSGNSRCALNLRGVTPWDNTHLLSKFGIKILKKTKYRVGPGGTMTYQMRDPRQHVKSRIALKEFPGCNIPGWTKHVLMIAKKVPGSDLDGNVVQRLNVGVTRKYTYKVEGVNDDRNVYDTR